MVDKRSEKGVLVSAESKTAVIIEAGDGFDGIVEDSR